MEILHLEDDAPLREIMHIALSAADPHMRMTQFIDSDAAMAYIEDHVEDITLFVLDVRVPGELDGLGVAKRVRELGSKRPILVTSAYRKPDQEKMTAYNCQWLAKPWHLLDAPQTLLSLARDDTDFELRASTISEAMRPKSKRPAYNPQRTKSVAEETPQSYVEEMQEIMEPVQVPPDDDTSPEFADEPLPFDDEPLALYDATNQETDIFVTHAYLEQEIAAALDEAEQMVYKSDDAPVVEPFEDDTPEEEN
jgi:response regulator of citrate/malate metabolism